MSQSTFFLSLLLDDITPPSMEMPFTSLVGWPYLEHVSALTIYNSRDSGVDLIVKKVQINTLTGQSQALPTGIECSLVSALSGGEDMTPIKMDTNNPDLPSQVLIRKYPTLVTKTSTVRRFMNMQTLNFTAALRALARGTKGASSKKLNLAEMIASGYGDYTDIQNWTLREGEGLAFTQPLAPLTMAYGLQILLSTESGYYYLIQSIVRPESVTPIFGVFNGSGSGEIIRVNQIELREVGEDTMPYFTVEKIDGISLEGVNIPATKMDTASGNLPSQVIIQRGAQVLLAGAKFGAVMSNPSLRRSTQNTYGTGPGFSGVDMIGVNNTGRMLDIYNADIPIRQGEGIALIQKNASQLGKFEIYLEFNAKTLGGGTPGLTEEIIANNLPMTYIKKGKAAELKSKIIEP